jgi:hypothetical protein
MQNITTVAPKPVVLESKSVIQEPGPSLNNNDMLTIFIPNDPEKYEDIQENLTPILQNQEIQPNATKENFYKPYMEELERRYNRCVEFCVIECCIQRIIGYPVLAYLWISNFISAIIGCAIECSPLIFYKQG